VPNNRMISRDYVQPQWVFDSINFRVLAPVHLYEPGKKLPPHVSPFVDHNAEQYKPDFVDTMERLAAGEDALADKTSNAGTERADEEYDERRTEEDDAQPQDEEEEEHRELQREFEEGLEAELHGKSAAESEQQKEQESENKRKRRQEKEDEEAQEMSHLLLPRKKRELYEAMQLGIGKKQQRAQELRRRKKNDATAGQ